MPKNMGKYDSSFRENMFQQIEWSLKQEGYTLKSTTYVNNRTKLEMKCPNGHTWWASWDNIRQGKRCKYCYLLGIEKAVQTRKVKRKKKPLDIHRAEMYQKFKKAVEAEGYIMISELYINNRTKVKLKCPHGHEWSTSWNQFDSGKRCKTCWMERSRLTQEQVAEELERNDCELLSAYKGVFELFKYRCSCDRISYIRLSDFRKGTRCQACGGEKRRATLRSLRMKKLKEQF